MEQRRDTTLFAEGIPFRATKMWNELVSDFKAGIRLKKKRWRMKYYNDCFSGSEALVWIHDYLKVNPNYGPSVTRNQAQLLCQKFLQQNVFEDILPKYQTLKLVFEEGRLYSFAKQQNSLGLETDDGKENKDVRAFASNMAKSSLKRTFSFSGNVSTRKPLGQRTGLQNTVKETQITGKNQVNPKKKRVLGSAANPTILENSVASSVKPHHEHAQLLINGGSLPRKWNSAIDLSLNQKYTQGNSSEKSALEIHNLTNKAGVLGLGLSDHGRLNKPCMTESNVTGSKIPCGDNNELWKDVCLERLRCALNVPVDSMKDILDCHLLSWKNVMENVKSDSRQVKESVPKWLVSAMKCLIHWPNSKDSLVTGMDYAGFEKDVFKTICDHFQSISEPLLPLSFLEVLTKISGLITKCKLSAIRALQYTFLLLRKHQKQQLQLLLRFMIKISRNHQLMLSNDLPTRELVIQTFVPCIFSGDKNPGLIEVLGIRITSFVVENYCEVFKVPDGLHFEVEQKISFRRRRGQAGVTNQGELRSDNVAFCQRVTAEEYEEQKRFGTQRFLEELLNSIINDEKFNERERKKKLKQFRKTYPEIYFSQFPGDGLSVMSHQPVQERLRQVMKPQIIIKNLR